jgi:hypothetical protein
LRTIISNAVKQYAADVREQQYPAPNESYEMPAALAEQVEKDIGYDENEIPYVIYAE